MARQDQSGRDRILTAAVELLQAEGVDGLTVRAVADRAGVGLGLINYHFGSKDELLYEAVNVLIGKTAADWKQPLDHSEVDPETRLRQLIRERGRLVSRFPDLFQVVVSQWLLEGDFEIPQQVLPLLREIFGNDKRELELRMIAYSMMVSVQLALLRPQAFQRYTGLDLFDVEQREMALDSLVNSVLTQKTGQS